MNKGSDLNVSSIEEDIKIVKELLKGAKDYGLYNGNEYFYSIENILQDYTRQKQINEEYQKINVELREKVKELELENRMFKNNKVLVSRYFKLKDNSIPKQKIKDMFEELQTLYEKKLKEIDFEELKSISLNIFEGIKIEVERDLLRRLLQESEDK